MGSRLESISLVLAMAVLGQVAGGWAPAAAQNEDSPVPVGEDAAEPDAAAEVRRLEERVRELEELYERRIRELEERLAALEAELAAARAAAPAEEDAEELAALVAEAEALAADQAAREEEAERARESFVGGERALQALNPEISFLGDFSYDWTSGEVRDGFLARGVELSFQAALDPYTRFKGYLAGHQEPFELEVHEHEGEGHEGEEEHAHGEEIAVNVEEAYVEWVALPLNTRLRVGKFRQQFGTLNRWHRHALATADSPFALQNVFGHEGLSGIGVGLDWQLPRLWASSNGLTVEITNADNPSAFAGSDWQDPAFLVRHTGFFDLGPDAYLDLGLSWAFGPNDATGDRTTDVYGLDLAYVWEPVNRAKYRNFELRGELIRTRFEQEDGATLDSTSYYGYLSAKLSRRWTVGLRWDDAELPWDRFELAEPESFREGLRERAVTPFATFWQSEFVRLRLQYQSASRDFAFARGDASDDKFWLQLTFAAGPHKHESY